MKRLLSLIIILVLAIPTKADEMAFGKGRLRVRKVARNAVRIQYREHEPTLDLPDWLYVKNDEVKHQDIMVEVDEARQTLTINKREGKYQAMPRRTFRIKLPNGTETNIHYQGKKTTVTI